MRRDLTSSLLAILVLTAVLGLAYPLFTTGVAQVLFPGKAGGSRIERDGRTIGSRLIAQAHVCRSLARSAERRCQQLNAVESIRGVGLAYVNRLSDLLFVAARLIAKRQGIDEVLWQAAPRPQA